MLTPDATVYGDLTPWAPAPFGPLFADANYCGRSFDEGLLRFHNATSGAEAGELAAVAFGGDIEPGTAFFAVDWLGRQYGARSSSETDDGDAAPVVVIADIGTGFYDADVAPLDEFIGVLGSDAAPVVLGAERYAAWRQTHGAPQLDVDQCLGYAHPLFLGGPDSLANLELSDISVYWTVIGQVFATTRDLPAGTRVSRVSRAPEV